MRPDRKPPARLAPALLPGLSLVAASLAARQEPPSGTHLPGGESAWTLAWSDEFDYPDDRLEQRWRVQNSGSTHILSSRWRENVQVRGGTLRLTNRKERRGGNDWTSGNIWTRDQFKYGYFECRYRYAAAEGTNNSFWIMTTSRPAGGGKSFEIDINEGHFPNEVNTNIHNHSDVIVVNGRRTHPTSSRSFVFGVRPDVGLQLESPVRARRIRLSSSHEGPLHVAEFRAFGPSQAGYPEVLSEAPARGPAAPANLAADPATAISVSGHIAPAGGQPRLVADGKLATRWVSQREGEKWIELRFAEPRTVGCVQFVAGYLSQGEWKSLPDDYRLSYHDGRGWVEMRSFDVRAGSHNFAREYHTYGLEWSQDWLVFYLDGKVLRRERNEFCHSPAPVWLSLAVIPWAGKVTDAIDGTSMEVDFVRIHRRR